MYVNTRNQKSVYWNESQINAPQKYNDPRKNEKFEVK